MEIGDRVRLVLSPDAPLSTNSGTAVLGPLHGRAPAGRLRFCFAFSVANCASVSEAVGRVGDTTVIFSEKFFALLWVILTDQYGRVGFIFGPGSRHPLEISDSLFERCTKALQGLANLGETELVLRCRDLFFMTHRTGTSKFQRTAMAPVARCQGSQTAEPCDFS
jgi:hypothetical protein